MKSNSQMTPEANKLLTKQYPQTMEHNLVFVSRNKLRIARGS